MESYLLTKKLATWTLILYKYDFDIIGLVELIEMPMD
jgi:hypothetical protein